MKMSDTNAPENRKRLSLNLKDDSMDMLKRMADKEERSLSNMASRIISKAYAQSFPDEKA
jgi:uncharacterized protein (DUF1778 family)